MELLTWAWKTFCDMMPLHQFSYWNFHHAKSFHSFMLLHLLTYPLGFPDSSVGKESACNAGDLDSIPGWGRSTGKESALLERPFPECVCVCVCVCACVCMCVYVQSLSHVQLFVTPWTGTHQVPLSIGFPRQEYWSRLPFLPPGDLPHPRIKPASPVLAG